MVNLGPVFICNSRAARFPDPVGDLQAEGPQSPQPPFDMVAGERGGIAVTLMVQYHSKTNLEVM